MLTSHIVELKWNKRNKNYYITLGYMFTRIGDTFIVKIDHVQNSSKIMIPLKCDRCGKTHTISMTGHFRSKEYANHGLGSYICYGCSRGQHNIKSDEQFKNEISEKYKGEFIILEKYQRDNKKILVKHKLCKFEYSVTPSNLIQGSGCPKCAGTMRKSTETFIKEIYDKVGFEYSLLSPYTNAKFKVEMFHAGCQKTYFVTPNDFLSGYRCPYCSESKGEKRISSFLNQNNNNYKSQYKINDCKNILPLRFDFAVFNQEDQLILLIEYDGIQHFQPAFGEEPFKRTKNNDEIKDSYCKNNRIEILRIPYTQFNSIEEMLFGFLLKQSG